MSTALLYFLKKYQLEPKRLQFVHSYANGPAKIFLLEAVFQANSGGLEILPPLVVYQAEGEYTEQLKVIKFEQFQKRFQALGFIVEETFGNYDLSPFNFGSSPRQIWVLKKTA